MTDYFNAAVCINGHVLTNYLRDNQPCDSFCEMCGGKIILRCSNCHTPIRGNPADGFVVFTPGDPQPPNYCPVCGNPYPWTDKAIFSLVQLLKEEDELDLMLVEKIESSIPDVISDTPGTGLAAVRFKKLLVSGSEIIKDAVEQFASSFACEAFKNLLNL